MRIFTERFGEKVDLDDPKTYSYLPTEVEVLRKLMFQEIGYFFCYTKFWHEDIFSTDDYGQVERVMKMIKVFTEQEDDHREDVLWYQERVYLFQEEIENMC